MEIIKRAFLDAAIEELHQQGQPVSDSKLSIMTGLQRKDVARLKAITDIEPPAENLLSRIIGLWCSKRFTDGKGRPKKLTIEGKESQFATLVHQVSKDLNHHTVLFELERLGLVVARKNQVTLKLPAFIVKGNVEQAAALLHRDIQDLMGAVHENITDNGENPHLHAKTEYDNIPAEHLPRIQDWFLKTGRLFHQQARTFLSQFDRDTNPKLKNGSGRHRVTIGTFSFTEKFRRADRKSEGEKR